MKIGHCKSLELFAERIKEYMKDHKNTLPTEWTIEFTENIWEIYCVSQESTKDDDDSSGDPSKAMESITIHGPTSNVTNIKIDIKSYPLFDGKSTEWKGYKRQFVRVATIHGIAYLFEESLKHPDVRDPLLTKFTVENTFLQSVLEYSLVKSTVASRVKRFAKSRNGKEA